MEVGEDRLVSSEIAVAGAKPFVVVGIPAFNEEALIARVVLQAQKFSDSVVVCDDGSYDLTGEIAERLGAYVIRHERNTGYGTAIRSLVRRARELDADVLVTLDGDGQHDPGEIPRLLQPIVQDEADLVIGSRFIEGSNAVDMPSHRRVGARLITKLFNWSIKSSVKDAQSGFRAYNRRAFENLSIFESGMGASVEILKEAEKNDLRVCEVSSSCKYDSNRVASSSRNPLVHGLDVVMSIVRLVVEEKPLTVLGIPGLLCLFAGVVFGSWMLQIYAVEHHIVTNIALASMAFVFIGFFLLSSAITLYAISRLAERVKGAK